jgi:hypothetical protein
MDTTSLEEQHILEYMKYQLFFSVHADGGANRMGGVTCDPFHARK